MPIHLDAQQWALTGLLVATLILLLTEKLRIDLTAVLVIVALPILGILEPEAAFSGFGSEPAIVVASVFVLSGAMTYTGLSDRLGARIARIAGQGGLRMLAVLMLSVAGLSAFTHHLTVTAIMLPVTLKLCRDQQIPPSRLLMPVSFASSLGTTITILGAPAFLIADRLLEQVGRPGLGVLSIAPIGLSITFAGTALMLLAGRLLLPDRKGSENLEDQFRLDSFYTEVLVEADSSLIGKTIEEVDGEIGDLRIFNWVRDGKLIRKPYRGRRMSSGDVLLVRASPEELAALKETPGLALNPAVRFNHPYGNGANGEETAVGQSGEMVQAVIGPQSDLIGRTIAQSDFFNIHHVVVVGIWRRRGWLRAKLSRVRLRAGDVLVLLGSSDDFLNLRRTRAFLLLMPFAQDGFRRHKAPLAAAIMLGTVVVAALELLPVETALLAGAVLAVLTGCLTVRQAYKSIDVRVYLFIAGAIPLGLAMTVTGLSDVLAGWIASQVGGWPPVAVLSVLFLISALLTQLMSDAGTTVLLGPIAIALAISLNRPPEWFVVTVAVAAVASFITPIGHHGNLLIYGPGGYEFRDFIKAGVPLTIATALIVILLIPVIWPAG